MKTLDERLDGIVKESVAEVVAQAEKVVRPRGAGNSRFEAKDSADFFPTPAWATRALIEHVIKPLGLYRPHHEVWEPACGALDMARPLSEYYDNVYASDIEPRGDPYGHCGDKVDFLAAPTNQMDCRDWIITNPPFNLLTGFLNVGMLYARVGIALLVPLTVVEGRGRYDRLYKPNEGRYCAAAFVERVPIIKNRVRRDATTARDYVWLIVTHDISLPPLLHIPPCRKELERDEDYV